MIVLVPGSLQPPCAIAHQAPLPMVFSRQEYWRGLTFVPPGDLPDPGIKPMSSVSPALQADSLPTEPSGKHKTGIVLQGDSNDTTEPLLVGHDF